MDRTVADPMIGRVLDGRYRVGPRVARGGMATVYEAMDLRLDRLVAIKIMHAGLGDDDDFAGRFVREAHSAARLSHPNVVGVFDQGDDDGTLFLAMEYVPGHTLRDLIRKEAPMSPAKALKLLDPVLSALGAAHNAGMIHRDVKPENVLIADDGRVKVADFGLARAVSAETQHTATGGVLIGTVSYLSPELVIDGRADARSDVYAAGVLIYEMLTGHKPHQADSPIQVAYKHVHEDVPPPSEAVPGIPPYVDALVARATARDRERRPADARVLLHQVRRVRAALDQGLADDPELTADLTPTAKVARDLDDIDYVNEDPPTIVTPAQAAGRTGSENTSVIGTGLPAARPSGPDRPQPARPAGQRSRRRRGPHLLVVVLLLAALAGVGGWYYGMGRYVATPGVIGLTSAQARVKVHAAGLGYQVAGRQYSETVAAGRVVSTDPGGGDRILKHGTVDATISRGPERHAVPRLRGLSVDQAQRALQHSHLAYGTSTYRYSDNVAKGTVLSSDPKQGQELRRGTAVDLVVSRGARPIPIPDFTGRSARLAEHRLGRLGFSVSTASTQYDDNVPRGDVISQSPNGGTGHHGDAISLVVSKGPQLVQVPNVRSMGVQQATQTLQAAGLQVSVTHSNLYVGLGYVVSQDPGADQMVPRGTVVTISLV
ncbi:MAG: Stk1 family PASTA domain-containing Ser/Thr kinase [Nocardioidaceae bacterium]